MLVIIIAKLFVLAIIIANIAFRKRFWLQLLPKVIKESIISFMLEKNQYKYLVMDSLNGIVESKRTFISKVEKRLAMYGRKTAAAGEIGISRKALWKFLRGDTVRKSTLDAIVRKFEGESANINDFIKKL